jgi:glycosyltransferase involved in cell wall biosynthesis
MNAPKQTLPSILHCCSASDAGGMQTRCIRLIEALAREARHALVLEGEGTERLGAKVSRPTFPSLTGAPWPGRLKRLAAAMAGYDLICTYGAGALDATLAHTLFADVYKLAPLVHHEGAGEGGRSNLYRRLALGRTAALVVPSREAEHIALEKWQQPRHRVRLIPTGIDTAAYAATPKRDAAPGLIKRRDELWLGTFARPEGLAPLIRTITTLPQEWQLVVVAEERSHEPIRAEAARAGIDDRVHPVSPPAQPARLIGLFDLFASTDGATGILEAMATGLSVIAPRDSEAAALVASENGPFLTARVDEAECVAAVASLAGDRTLRRRIGEANRTKAGAEFDEKQMIERTRALYRSLTGTL